MFHLHKRLLKAVRANKKQNSTKEKPARKSNGTGLTNLCSNVAARQFSVDTQTKQYFDDNYQLHVEAGQWNHRSELYCTVSWLYKTPIPKDWRTHDRTRWSRNKQKTRERCGARDLKAAAD